MDVNVESVISALFLFNPPAHLSVNVGRYTDVGRSFSVLNH